MAKKKKKSTKRKRMGARTRKDAENSKKGGGFSSLNLPEGVEFFKPSKKCDISILPYIVSDENHPQEIEVGEPWWKRTIYVHKNMGSQETDVLCPQTIGKSKCPICEEHNRLKKDPDVDKDEANAFRAKKREVMNIYTDDGVQLWDISYYLFGELRDEEVRESDDEAIEDFAEMEGGQVLKCRFKEKTFNGNKFLEISKISFEERDDLDEELLEESYDIDAMLEVKSYKELKALLEGDDEEEDDDDVDDEDDEDNEDVDEDDDPDDEDEDEDEPEDEDEDDEDEDPDDDWPDDDDEDEEDEPVRKKKPKKKVAKKTKKKVAKKKVAKKKKRRR